MDDAAYKERRRRLGLRIAYYRKLKGLTQEQLAELLNKSWAQIAKVETGNSGASLRLLWEIADVLDIKIENFFAEE